MDKKKLKIILIEISLLVLQIVLSQINLFNCLCSTGLAFAFARVCAGSNIIVVSIFYLISKAQFIIDLQMFFVLAYEIVLLALYYLCKEYLSDNKNFIAMIVFGIVAQFLSLYLSFKTMQNFLNWTICFVWFVLMMIYFHKLIIVFKKKFVFFKFAKGDYFMFAIFVALITLGFFSFGFAKKYLFVFILTLVSLFFSKIFPTDKYIIFVGIISICFSLISGLVNYVFISMIILVCMIGFKEYSKYFQGLFSLFLFSGICFFFKLFHWTHIAGFLLSVVLFVCVPQKWVVQVASMFEAGSLEFVFKYANEQKNQLIKNKLLLMSQTFRRMQTEFKFLMVGKINRTKAAEELAVDVISKCCNECENFRFCFMENINKKEMFERLMSKAIACGSVCENDMQNGMQAYCFKHGVVLAEINQIAEMFLRFESKMKSDDTSKLLISNELGNFADIFSNFAKIVNKSLKINEKTSKNLKNELFYAMVNVKDVVVFENEQGVENVCLIAPNEEMVKKEIVDVVSKHTKNKMQTKHIQHIEISGLSLMTLKPAAKLKANIAVSTKGKETKNGDSCVVSKIGENKIFVAIADGMGHGENAKRVSSMVLSLIRSMFEVGLDYELIVNSVNKLLLPVGLEQFSTLDSCVIDFEKGICTFVKLGSSVSAIKHTNNTEIVSCDSLPIGIVQNIKPTIIQKNISFGDTIFLASDGVVDSFSSIENYRAFINDSKCVNLQKFIDNIIFDSASQNLKHSDDMTIIAVNLLKN